MWRGAYEGVHMEGLHAGTCAVLCAHVLPMGAMGLPTLTKCPIPSFLTHFHIRQIPPPPPPSARMRFGMILTQEPESHPCPSHGAAAALSSPWV